MGRYTFRDCVREVLPTYAKSRSASTIEVMQRRYNRMERELTYLRNEGLISSTSPCSMTWKDIDAYWRFLIQKTNKGGLPISIESIKKDFIDLNKLCRFYGNGCVSEFSARTPALSSRKSRKRLPTLKESHIEMVISRSAEILPSDFRRIRAYALVSLYLGAGLRTIEMCHAKLSNLDLTEGGSTIYLDHVKGNDSYGEPRIVVIIPDFVPAIKRYLYARSNLLQKEEVNTDALFFSLDNYAPLSDKTVRQIRMIVESDLSVKFDGRECRRTYGQYLKDCGVSIENVSINMGHTSTKTTERYYARQRNDRAVSETFATLRCMK